MKTILSTIDTSDYDLPDLKVALNSYIKESVSQNRAIGCMGSNHELTVPLDKVSHLVTALEFNEYTNKVDIRVNILDTLAGKDLSICDVESVYFSIHGLGNIVKGKKHMDTIISINANVKNQ